MVEDKEFEVRRNLSVYPRLRSLVRRRGLPRTAWGTVPSEVGEVSWNGFMDGEVNTGVFSLFTRRADGCTLVLSAEISAEYVKLSRSVYTYIGKELLSNEIVSESEDGSPLSGKDVGFILDWFDGFISHNTMGETSESFGRGSRSKKGTDVAAKVGFGLSDNKSFVDMLTDAFKALKIRKVGRRMPRQERDRLMFSLPSDLDALSSYDTLVIRLPLDVPRVCFSSPSRYPELQVVIFLYADRGTDDSFGDPKLESTVGGGHKLSVRVQMSNTEPSFRDIHINRDGDELGPYLYGAVSGDFFFDEGNYMLDVTRFGGHLVGIITDFVEKLTDEAVIRALYRSAGSFSGTRLDETVCRLLKGEDLSELTESFGRGSRTKSGEDAADVSMLTPVSLEEIGSEMKSWADGKNALALGSRGAVNVYAYLEPRETFSGEHGVFNVFLEMYLKDEESSVCPLMVFVNFREEFSGRPMLSLSVGFHRRTVVWDYYKLDKETLSLPLKVTNSNYTDKDVAEHYFFSEKDINTGFLLKLKDLCETLYKNVTEVSNGKLDGGKVLSGGSQPEIIKFLTTSH